MEADTESAGDGSQQPSDESLRAIADAEIYLGFGMPQPLWKAARRLRWIHSASAGVASLLFPEMLASEVLLTNSAGVYGEPIAEHVLAGVLFLLHSFDVAGSLQRRGEWNSADLRNRTPPRSRSCANAGCWWSARAESAHAWRADSRRLARASPESAATQRRALPADFAACRAPATSIRSCRPPTS